jgi:hypothetical protein
VSKFTVIEGGGPPDRDAGAARYHLQQAIVEILRSLVRGYDTQDRISVHLNEVIRHLNNTEASLKTVVSDSILELHKELNHPGERGHFVEETEAIVLCALQVAAEAMAVDPGAKGRLSKRQSQLQSAIDHRILRREQRAKEWQRTAPRTPKEKREALTRALETVERLKRQNRKSPKASESNPDDDTVA